MTSSDCPLCLNEFSKADTMYALKCPTPGCDFNYCADCIQQLQRSAKDGYQEASDGSRQLKVHVQCPQCREKYQCQKYSSDIIVSAVLLLRQAVAIQETILNQVDSELSATQLGAKHSFFKQTSLEGLQDAVRRLQVYQNEIGSGSDVPALDWDAWRPHIPEFASSSAKETQQAPWRDPTLFRGLDELMTLEEQEFVTALLTSGKIELLSQAAHILNGILDMAASRTVQQLSNFATPAISTDVQMLQRIRKKYPLPARMPRCVQLPVFNPQDGGGLLKLDKKGGLALVSVKGPSGRVGLRKGDVVTHVNGDLVHTQEEYANALHYAQETGDENFWLVVNADMETAHEIKKRAEKMQEDKVKF